MLKHIFVVVVLCILLTGCSEKIEIEDRDFVMALGIDYDGSNLSIGFGLPDLSKAAGDTEGGGPSKVSFIKGKTMLEVKNKYNKQSSKILDYGHLKAIIFGESILKNEDKLREVLSSFDRDESFARTVLVLCTQGTAEDVLALNDKVASDIGLHINGLYNNNLVNQSIYPTNLGELINQAELEDQVQILPKITIWEEQPRVSGAGVVKGSRLVGYLDDRILSFLALTKGKGGGIEVEVNASNGQSIIVEIVQAKAKHKVYAWNNNLKFVISIKGEAKIFSSSIDGKVDLFQEANIKKINKEFNDLVSRETDKYIRIMQEAHIDYLNTKDIVGLKNRDFWIAHQADWQSIYPNILFEVNTNIDIMR